MREKITMNDTETSSSTGMDENIGLASSMSAGQMMLTASHAAGLMFGAAVSQQQLINGQTALAATSKSIFDLLDEDLGENRRENRITKAVEIARMIRAGTKNNH